MRVWNSSPMKCPNTWCHTFSSFFLTFHSSVWFLFVSMVCTIRPLLINYSCKPHRIAAFIASLFEYFSRYIVMITVTRLHENPAVKRRRIRSNKEKKYCQFEPSSSYPYNCFLPSRGLIYLIHCSPFRPCVEIRTGRVNKWMSSIK